MTRHAATWTCPRCNRPRVLRITDADGDRCIVCYHRELATTKEAS